MPAKESPKNGIFGWLLKRQSKSLFPAEWSERAMVDFQHIADALQAGRLPEPLVWQRLQVNVEDMIRIKREYTDRKQGRRVRRGGTQRPVAPIDQAMRQAASDSIAATGGERENYEERIFWNRFRAEFSKFLDSLRTPKMYYSEMDWKRMERNIKFRIRSIQFQRLQAMPDVSSSRPPL